MAIRNILVDFSGSPSSHNAVRLGRLMQDKYDAHLTGVLTWAPSEVSATLRPFASADLAQAIEAAEKDRRAAVRDEFFRVLGRPEGDKVHWIEAGGDVDYTLMELSHTYDIVLLGQYDGTRDTRNLVPHPDVVALNAGRPVMIVPREMPEERLNEKAVLAWDGGRAAARALADSLDILETKTEVTVVSIGEGTAEVVARLNAVITHLERHGIAATSEVVPRAGRSIGQALLDVVDEVGAGLLIMGAYERPKLLEDLMGGTTNAAISKAKVPVLMSH